MIIDYDVVDLTELLVTSAAELTLVDLLNKMVNDTRVVHVGQFTDEELCIVSGEVDEQLSPWLGGLTEPQRRVALREAQRNMVAEEIATFGENGSPVDIAPPISAMAWARSHFTMIVVADLHDTHDEVLSRTVLYCVDPDLFLVETISVVGYHNFFFCSRRAAGELLAVDARADIDQHEDQHDQVQGEAEILTIIERLNRTTRHRTSIYAREPLPGSDDDTSREVAVYDTPGGTWLCEYMDQEGGGTHVRTRRTGVEPLAAYLTNFLSPVGVS